MNRTSRTYALAVTAAGRWSACAAVAVVLAAGCATTPRGPHEIPVARDYRDLARVELEEAEAAMRQARRAGAAGFAPYSYAAAENYLSLAREARRNRDRAGAWDYAALALRYANAALADSPPASYVAPDDIPPDLEATRRAFERVLAEWAGLDHARAQYALPFLFADLTAALSSIEYDLNRGAWQEAARKAPDARIMLETLRTRDIDGDGIPDIDDPDPWRPEEEPAPPPAPPTLRPIAFGSGSVSLDAEAKGYLDAVADFFAENPEWTLHVMGHTDNRHSEAYNLDLSRRRAEAVQRYLTSAGAPLDRIAVSFYGSSRPVESAPAGVSNAANRRVELMLEHHAIPIE